MYLRMSISAWIDSRSKNGDFLSETEAGTFGRDFRHLKLQDEDTSHQIDWVAAASANDSSITDDECFDWEVGHVSQVHKNRTRKDPEEKRKKDRRS